MHLLYRTHQIYREFAVFASPKVEWPDENGDRHRN